MIWNILQLIFCITLFVLPLALYKSHRSFMVRFYDAMIHSVKARKLYVQVVLILLLLFTSADMLASSVFFFQLLSVPLYIHLEERTDC